MGSTSQVNVDYYISCLERLGVPFVGSLTQSCGVMGSWRSRNVQCLGNTSGANRALSILEQKGCEIIRSSYPHPVAEKDLERIIRGD